MKVRFGAKTDVGRERSENEDNFLVNKDLQLYVVCDGMGGHVAGKVASALSVNAVNEELHGFKPRLQRYLNRADGVTRKDILAAVESAIQNTCSKVYGRAQKNVHERGMGTTLSLLLLVGRRAFIGHVGDSRIYLLRGGTIHQLTEDHSLITEMLKAGRISSGDELDPRFHNAVTRAIGVHASVDVDTLDLEILPGDRFLVCSDGLYRYAKPEVLLEQIIGAPNESEATQKLTDYANERGGADNITSIVVRIDEVPDIEPEDVQLKLDTFRELALFRYLSYNELLKVLNLTLERRVKSGDYIFREGDSENCTYVILRGRVKIQKSNVIIAVLKDGYHFGEMALVDNEVRSADAVALRDTWLIEIPRAQFFELMRKNPALAVKLLWSFVKALTVRLRRTNTQLSLMKAQYRSVTPEITQDESDTWLDIEDSQLMRLAEEGLKSDNEKGDA